MPVNEHSSKYLMHETIIVHSRSIVDAAINKQIYFMDNHKVVVSSIPVTKMNTGNGGGDIN